MNEKLWLLHDFLLHMVLSWSYFKSDEPCILLQIRSNLSSGQIGVRFTCLVSYFTTVCQTPSCEGNYFTDESWSGSQGKLKLLFSSKVCGWSACSNMTASGNIQHRCFAQLVKIWKKKKCKKKIKCHFNNDDLSVVPLWGLHGNY